MNRLFTCIVCPVGCEINVNIEESSEGPVITEITGANCVRGRAYVENELKNPLRTVTSSVRVTGGTLPITSVRLTSPVPRARMMDVIAELRKVRIEAPVLIGQVVIKDILGLGSDVIVTKAVDRSISPL